jgi:hypothetical protein
MADQPVASDAIRPDAAPASDADAEEAARKRRLLVAILNSSRCWWMYEENPAQLQNVPWGGSV